MAAAMSSELEQAQTADDRETGASEEYEQQELVSTLPSTPALFSCSDEDKAETDPEPVAISHELVSAAVKEKLKKPQTAYFQFLAAKRHETKLANPGVGIGALQKIMAEMWRGLGDEEKEVYVKMAKEDKERYEKLKELTGEEDETSNIVPKSNIDVNSAFPIARVKKIIQYDSDVKKISKEATIAIGKATELFIASLAKKCQINAKMHKRKTIKNDDIVDAIYCFPVLEWLRYDFERTYPKQLGENQSNIRLRASKKIENPQDQKITNFWSHREKA